MSSQPSSKARSNGLSLGSFSCIARSAFPQNACNTRAFLICLDKSYLVERVLMRKPGVHLGLFDELSF
jgi:hypothetical protein